MNSYTASLPMPQHLPAAARQVLRLLARLHTGTLELQTPDGQTLRFGSGAEPRATLRLNNWQVCADTLRSGDVGFGEAYIAGQWSSPDVPALLRLFLLNRQALDEALYGNFWGRLLYRLRHLGRRNSRSGSRRNIQAHYDLGNAFYQLWLDETMNYSSAWFNGDFSQPLAQAQHAKMLRALAECGLRPGERVLEIGCGWGAVAQTAAQQGFALTGVTLSKEQLAYARQRLERLGLAERAELRLQDYRDITDPPFDAVVSIEMFEAVGQAYWPTFFASVRQRLKPGGRACIQTITIRDELFERYRRGTDFIQQYVFPGGLLPSPAAFRQAAGQAGLRVVNEIAFGRDYAETLRHWRHRFMQQAQQVQAQGFDANFSRLWEFYLAYCEAAFDTNTTNVMQFTLVRD
jgi:cyclopropane-fatty-acyl-phospholipid synthase